MAVKCHYFGLLLVVGLIALFPAKSVALFEYCENNNCTQTGTICQADNNQCVCDGATHYQTATLTCDAKVAADASCPSSYVNTQTPCLDLNAWCRQLVGSEHKCTCENGFSANSQGQCVQVADCPDLNNPTNGVVQTSIDADSGNATYTCNQGYVINGSNNQSTIRICENSLWADLEPTCSALVCSDLTDPDNGVVDITNNTEGGIATYTCNEGYVVVGANNQQVATRQCSNGTWSDTEPTCSLIDCGSPISTITNGQATVVGQSTVNSTVTVQCNIGFEITDDTVVTCLTNGNWSSAICELIDCGAIIDTITNGQATVGAQTTVNSTASVQCNIGYQTSTNTVTCLTNGNWSPATCSIIDCGSTISTITNGQASVVDQTTVNSTASVQCNIGYQTSTNSVTCQANGNWSSATCSLIDCGSTISTITNGQATVGDQTTVNSTATVQCNIGYETNTSTVTCIANGNWSSATCTIIDCGSTISTITNGQATVDDQSTVNTTATVQCNIGYETSTSTVTCQAESGNWSSAICSIIDCGSTISTITNGQATVGDQTTVNSTASVQCKIGYQTSTNTVTCLTTGNWSPATCTIIDCGSTIDTITNGQATVGAQSTVNSTATVQCNTGYEITDGTVVTCQANGNWSSATCTIIDPLDP